MGHTLCHPDGLTFFRRAHNLGKCHTDQFTACSRSKIHSLTFILSSRRSLLIEREREMKCLGRVEKRFVREKEEYRKIRERIQGYREGKREEVTERDWDLVRGFTPPRWWEASTGELSATMRDTFIHTTLPAIHTTIPAIHATNTYFRSHIQPQPKGDARCGK